jgi:type IV pilus assembly protein PilZ
MSEEHEGGDADADASERRRESRAPITLRVDYKRLNSFFADYTKNISKGGTFIRTTQPLAVGTEFVFVLSVPEPTLDNASVRLEMTGKVKWVVTSAEATKEKPAGMGIQFLFKAQAERDRVAHFVSELMRASLGPDLAAKLLKDA